ncbi:unnamed protein product, partial [Coregonus sp. 'balchen']
PSDVSPSTSLPPLVEGQLRCFLRVTVSRVLWTVPKPFPTTFIRLRWWGESSIGTQFKPRDASQTAQKTVKSTARFPIRCGPKQFTSYLTDMGSLVLEVLTKPEHLPIARAQVAGISRLSLSHSISGFFTLVSPTSEKLGELQVSLALEALTETYDSSCSVPTTDMSIETAMSAFGSTLKPASQPNILVVPSLSRPLSVNSGKESGSNTPRGKDHLYFQNARTEKKTDVALENQKPTYSRSQHGQGVANPTVQESPHGQAANDILSERGSKLRNAMVVSALKPSIPPCGRLLQNILHADSNLLQSPHSPPDYLSPDCTAADTENRAVDLLLGSLNGSALPIWDGEGSPPDSFLSVYGDSELNDPQYDQSLLENLFYKAPMCNNGPSDDDKAGPSPKKNLKKSGDGEELRHSGPKKSGGLDLEDVQNPGTEDMLPGLSMDQLTVLGGVRLARVVIHSLTVPPDSTTTTPRKISGKGKPPRPLSSKKWHDPSQAMAAERRGVFPVHFSGSTIKQWWGTELSFNIYSRKSSQKKPIAIGKAVFPLRCLLQREQLSQTIILPVQSLQGTDNKDFSSANGQRSAGAGSRAPSRALTSPQRDASPSRAYQVVVEEEDSEVLLHALLMVPNGKDFNCGPMQPPNVYLNCKLFGQDETSRSVTSWGQTNPSFNFVQVAPVALTSRLLDRMRNNVMVIEVWQRAGSSGQDRLLGLVKLPLHQFYMSFRDPKISHLLLQAQYPVLGVDSYMPVIDVFSGIIKGNLRVLLAMGLSGQIVSLQCMREEELASVSHLPRPAHLLDHQPHKEQNVKPSPEESMREHLFVVKVESVKGLTPLQSTVWGEADCYVQYTFPTQEEPPAQSVNLRQFRTTTTLCVPDPVFGHSESHVLLAPLVAKGMLPLSKLCAMVTMQRQQPTEAQVFSLPLMPRTDSPAGRQPQPSGLLDVYVHYKQRPLSSDVRGAVVSRVVTMVVQVHRAAGLQAAARALSEQDEMFQYYADVGVNVYVTAQLSFLPESERRSTRVSARTFCPEFDHHTEFPCELQVQRGSGETCSLAELLQEATAVFTVWNRDSRKVMVSPRSKNTLLGTVRIQLADLIHKRTGISGWFGVSLPQDLTSSPRHHIFVGGLDVSIYFAHHADRERVITAARGLGWEVGREEGVEEEEEEPPNEGEAWAETRRTVSLTVSMPRAWLPVHCLLLPGHSELQRSTYCYFRYKLYDGEAFCSQLRHPGLSVEEDGGGGEEGLATVAFRGSRTVELRSSQPLLWYLREEKLEVQVRSAPDLSGAALRVHITLTPGSLPEEQTPGGGDSQDQEDCDSQREEEEGGQGGPSSTAAVSRQSGTPSRHQTKSSMSVEPSQPCCPLAERSGGLPSCCVSYITADSAEPVTTALIADSHCPVWDHQQECRLSKQLLLDPQQSLVFKVWHKGDVERVIGFASVDLSPLLSGFQSVCGWYNITDFNGQCQGQLKVSVSPLKGVQELRGQRQAVCEDGNKDSSALFQTLPLYYHTTATYSSFPSHISRYTEQRINSTPDRLDRLLSERSSEGDRHDVHMDKVRLKNLSELDDIQRYFSRKLSTPTFPSLSEQGQDQRSRLDEHRDSDTDSSQLLLKSTRLVYRDIIAWRQYLLAPKAAQQLPLFQMTTFCLRALKHSPRVLHVPIKHPAPPRRTCLLSLHLYHEHSDSQADEEDDKAPASEDDEGGGPREEEEEDGDYEETVVEPRPLNEVTSLTDRTSPWTSLLSDPDLASLESLEAPEEHQASDYSYQPSLTQQERERLGLQTDTLQAWSFGEPIGSRLEERDQHVNSEFSHGPDTDEEEDTVNDGERTLQTSDHEAALHQESITAPLHEQSLLCSGETASRVPVDRDALSEDEIPGLLYDTAAFSEDDTEHVVGMSDIYQPETFLHREDNRKSKHSDPVEIPNFFLSSHHMEASMRALRIAPVFPLASSDPKKSSLRHGILCRRVPRPRPNIPPSSMKKEETKRIAKIFASHFKD